MFKYLGSVITEEVTMDAAIDDETKKATKIYAIVNKHTFKTKISIFNSIFVPALTYNSETWTVSEKQKQIGESKMPRRIADC